MQSTTPLDCAGYGNNGAFGTLLQNVTEFKVFYRFDDAAQLIGTSGVTNAVPFGNSIRDAAYIDGLGGVDPWNYVVAVIVCVTVQTDQAGDGERPRMRHPVAAPRMRLKQSRVSIWWPLPPTDESDACFRKCSPSARARHRRHQFFNHEQVHLSPVFLLSCGSVATA